MIVVKVTKLINKLREIGDIEFFNPGGGHSAQGWRIRSTGDTGSIPLTKHGDIDAAIRELKKALDRAGIDSSFL